MSADELKLFKETTHIFTVRANAKKFNREKLLSLNRPIARLPAKHNNTTAQQGTAEDASGVEAVQYLAHGARVVLRANLWVKAGLVNGSLGTVVDIVYEVGKSTPYHLPVVIMVKFDNYKGPTLAQSLFPIPTIERNWMAGNVSFSREQIPLSLAWESTVHQSQGQTNDKVEYKF